MTLVIMESPYKGKGWKDTKKNLEYARMCMKDCFKRGEYPFASHLLYIQEGVLDDKNLAERELGILAGLEWGKHADKTVVYINFGISKGMKKGIDAAKAVDRIVETRRLW